MWEQCITWKISRAGAVPNIEFAADSQNVGLNLCGVITTANYVMAP